MRLCIKNAVYNDDDNTTYLIKLIEYTPAFTIDKIYYKGCVTIHYLCSSGLILFVSLGEWSEGAGLDPGEALAVAGGRGDGGAHHGDLDGVVDRRVVGAEADVVLVVCRWLVIQVIHA